MAIPVIIAAMAVTALAGAYTAYKKGEISKSQLKKAEEHARNMEAKMKAPSGTAEAFTPEEYEFAQKYNPQIATYVEENRPELVTESGSQAEKRMQREALNRYSNLSQTGTDVIADAQREEALFDADAQDKARRNQIVQNMANRGLGGSGQDMLAQMQSSQDSAVNARSASLDAVKQAEMRRLGALDKMANMAGSVRSQNSQVEQNNANVMNSFNQRLASSKNLYNQNTAQTQNAAQQFNISNEQQTRNANTGLRNQTNLMNMTRQERAAEALREYQNAMTSGNFDRAIGATNARATADREMAADIGNTVTSTAAVGASMMGARGNAQAVPQAAPASNNPTPPGQLDLYTTKEGVYNDTNRTRSRYNT